MHVRDINVFFLINKTKSLHKIPSIFFKKNLLLFYFRNFHPQAAKFNDHRTNRKKNSNSEISIQNHWLFKFTLSKLMHQL
jgi:hypothetical protein